MQPIGDTPPLTRDSLQTPNVEQPQQPEIPPVIQKSGSPMSLVFVVVGVILLAAVGAGAYYLGTQKNPSVIEPPTSEVADVSETNTESKPAEVDPSEEVLEPKLLSYSDDKISFQYPPDWEIVQEVPQQFKYLDQDLKNTYTKDELYNAKMFITECTGPLLYNKEINSFMAFEIYVLGEDGAFCWGSGTFVEGDTRQSIPIDGWDASYEKWKRIEFRYPLGEDNSGEIVEIPWLGDYTYYGYNSTKSPSGLRDSIQVEMVTNQNHQATAQQAFVEVLSSFERK